MTNENRNQKSNWFRESFEATKAFMGAGGFPRTRTKRLFGLMVLAIVPALVLVPVTAQAQCNNNKITFEFFFLPNNVTVGTSQDMFVCLANVCSEDAVPSSSRLELSIPVGTKDTDLINPDDVGNLQCISALDDWCCEVNIMFDPDNPKIPINAIVTFEPDPRNPGDAVSVAEFETLCFTLTNVGVNSVGGNTLSVMVQIDDGGSSHWTDPVNRVLSVFKSLPGGPGAPSPWKTIGNDIFYNDGNVGIGTTTMPQSPLDVVGEILGDELTITGLVMADTVESTTGGFIFPDGTVQITKAGPGGITGYEIVRKTITGVAGFGTQVPVEMDCPDGDCLARCPDGKILLGGGARVIFPVSGLLPLVVSAPEGNAWRAIWVSNIINPFAYEVEVFAICADEAEE